MNNTYSIDIVCSIDDNYIMPTGVMLTSLFENNNYLYNHYWFKNKFIK